MRFLLLVGIFVAAVSVRLGPREHLLQPEGLLIHDLDTLRRLARIEAIDAAGHYPLVETHDGFPAGTQLHWTLPMDWVIRGLDPLVGWTLPRERGYEAGAVLAGPLLAAVAALLFALLASRLLGAGPGLVAGLLYAWSYPFVNTSLLGNGDHQTLQQLAAVLAVLGLLNGLREVVPVAAAAGTGSAIETDPTPAAWRWPLASGAALGFTIWVSTELMLLFYVFVLALSLLAVWPWPDARRRVACRRVLLPWSLGVLALSGLAHVIEHRDDLSTLAWDVVSWFQVWQVAVFVLFAAGVRVVGTRRGPFAVVGLGAAALALGCLPLLVPSLRDAVVAQTSAAAEVSVWLHGEVSEFRSLGSGEGIFAAFARRDGYLVLALPLALVGLAWARIGAVAALTLGTLGAATLALYLWEVKLGHLFALVFPVVLVAGWQGVLRRCGGERHVWLPRVAAALAVSSVFLQLPGPRAPTLRNNDLFVRDICAQVASRRAGALDASVLAPWDMGAPLMYRAGVGVVASGYHRNIEGIRDGFRFWLADVADRAAAMDLLRQRRVRWVVAWYDRGFFDGGARTIGVPPLITEHGLLPQAMRTMYWQLRYSSPEGFRLVAEGPQIRRRTSDPPEPIYRLWERVE